MLFDDSANQPVGVDTEKQGIYEPTVPFFGERYRVGNYEIAVFGLFIGSGIFITKFFNDFRKGFRSQKK